MHVTGNHLVRCSVILVILGFKNSKMSFRPSSLMAAKLHVIYYSRWQSAKNDFLFKV